MPAPTPYWLVLYEDEGLSPSPIDTYLPGAFNFTTGSDIGPAREVLQFFRSRSLVYQGT